MLLESVTIPLSFNHDKSNVLIIGQRTNNDKRWRLGKELISEVDSYKYLGVYISRNLTDHCHVEEVIKKGNRLIAYVKSVINNFDDFNRVYYGDILWKTIVLPSINYASAVWIPGSQADIERLENLQLQMARYILKASRSTPRAALYGDLGWEKLSSIQNTARLKYLARIIDMNSHRWPKLLFNTMISLYIDPARLRYNFLSHTQDILNSCDFYDVLDCAKTGRSPEDPFWANSIKHRIHNVSVVAWQDEVNTKSCLIDYRTVKDYPCMENYLLDKTDFYGASLKFKIRSNTLPLEYKLSKWTPDNDGTCKLCYNGLEDVKHFLFVCHALNSVRNEEYKKLERDLTSIECFDIWELFISSNLDVKYNLVLGSTSTTFININTADDIFCTFNQFYKSYAKRAWKLRSELKSVPLPSE